MIRAFVAVPIEEAVVRRRLLGARSLLPPVTGLRWIPEGQLHFTLKFLGEIEEERLPAARAATAAAAASVPFRLALEGLGSFPPRGPVRILWARCGDGAGALTDLAGAVEEAFSAEGFPREERSYSPHLTLGRVRDPEAGRRLTRILPTVPSEPFGTVLVSTLVLFRSDLTSRGPDYAELFRAAIESAAAPQ